MRTAGFEKAELEHVLLISSHSSDVMAGLDPAIHVFGSRRNRKDVDARDKRGHDEECSVQALIHSRATLVKPHR
jgi:hypothetical protein